MTTPDFAARTQLSEDVARFVRRRIFDGSYAAGQYVRLDQLAAELGISVTPVREALFALRAEGWVAQQPHRGFVVLPVTGRDVTDVANVQAHVGGELAARAAVNITDDQLRHLKEIQAQLEEAYAGSDDERTVRLNHEFHRAINVAADSPKLAQLMSQITRYAPESVFPSIEGWPGQSIKDHRRVLSALKKRDAELARDCDVGTSRRRRYSADRAPPRPWGRCRSGCAKLPRSERWRIVVWLGRRRARRGFERVARRALPPLSELLGLEPRCYNGFRDQQASLADRFSRRGSGNRRFRGTCPHPRRAENGVRAPPTTRVCGLLGCRFLAIDR